MRIGVALANLALGFVYTSYGMMTFIEMRRGWKTNGFSHFGAAWIAMAFTCGPHHLEHGLHGLFAGRHGSGLDLAAVLVGAPAGVTWFLLRVEAFQGGRGDRFASGTPRWIAAIPPVLIVYLVVMAVASVPILLSHTITFTSTLAPNVLLFGLYMAIGYFLTRTQLRSRRDEGGWSVSGLTLAIVFPTCALMHAVHVLYWSTHVYDIDWHILVTDILGVPAAAYFLWVVHGLYKDTLQDWNRAAPEAVPVLAG